MNNTARQDLDIIEKALLSMVRKFEADHPDIAIDQVWYSIERSKTPCCTIDIGKTFSKAVVR